MDCWKEIKHHFYNKNFFIINNNLFFIINKSYIWCPKKIADIFLLVSEFYQFPKEEMGFVVVYKEKEREKGKDDLKYLINYSNPHKLKSYEAF